MKFGVGVAPPLSYKILRDAFDAFTKESNMSKDYSNAKAVAYNAGGDWYLLSRKNRFDLFRYNWHEDWGTRKEKDMAAWDAIILEEFPIPTLEELVGDAPAFEATDCGYQISRLWAKRQNGRWGAVNVRDNVLGNSSPTDPTLKRDYSLADMDFIDLDTVVRYYPDPRP